MSDNSIIIFNDTQNKDLNIEYAEKLKKSFRILTGWEVKPGTRIDKELDKFSMGYSLKKRDTAEVATIFCIANEIIIL